MVAKRTRMRKPKRLRKKRGYKTNNNLSSLNPIAQRYICKMKYAEVVTSPLGGGTYGLYALNLNSIFDPNRTGIGHQPYGHDTFQTMYNRYRVIACSYRVAVSSSDGAAVQFAIQPTNEAIAPANVSEVRENPRTRYALQGATGSPVKFISGKVYLPSLMGRSKAQYMADDRYQATFGTSPSELGLLNIYSSNLTESASAATHAYNVELTYTIECFDVKHLAQS